MNWEQLTTISTFDHEAVNQKYLCVNNTNSQNSHMTYSDPNDLIVAKPTTAVSLLIQGLIDTICKMMDNDNENMKIACKRICQKLNEMSLIDDSYAKNEFSNIREFYKKQIYKIFESVLGENKPIKLHIEPCWSRYETDFEEIRYIGGGGFGKVFKARHKLDTIEYAVKQIKINTTKIKLYHISEVKTIASLNHPNIVQYKSAWLEPLINFESTKNCNISSEVMQLENCENQSTSSNSYNIVNYNSNLNYIPQNPKYAILYIQMSLCKLTLQEWIHAKKSLNLLHSFSELESLKSNQISYKDISYNIFYQILEGLDYIHSKKIIHHDIKPSNIFLDFGYNGDIIAQLGDFGLACPLQDDHIGYPLGTKLYAAPEQLEGECNSKSDVYSLGIVLLELLCTCNTDMERVELITNARKAIFPLQLSKPTIQLLTSLLSSKKKRPTTKEVLSFLRKFDLKCCF